VGRASNALIGLGSNNLEAGVSVTDGLSNGISVESANALIILSTITGNQLRGISVSNGGSARIGLNGTSFDANTISNNGSDGIGLFHGSGAIIGGNTISNNTASGINVGRSNVDVVGGNNIANNGSTGIFVSGGQALIGDPGFGSPSAVNTITGNGSLGPNNGGVFAFLGGTALVADADINNNTGTAVQAFESSSIDLRGATSVTTTGTADGASVNFGSTLRIRDTASIVAGGHGISAGNLSGVAVRDGNTVTGGAGRFGVNCFSPTPMTASAATLNGGNLTQVTGGAGATNGCNVFP
jgi:hypothetical protein